MAQELGKVSQEDRLQELRLLLIDLFDLTTGPEQQLYDRMDDEVRQFGWG